MKPKKKAQIHELIERIKLHQQLILCEYELTYFMHIHSEYEEQLRPLLSVLAMRITKLNETILSDAFWVEGSLDDL